MAEKKKKGTMKGHTIKGGHKRPTKSGAGMTAKGVAKYRRENHGLNSKPQLQVRLKRAARMQRGVSHFALVPQVK